MIKYIKNKIKRTILYGVLAYDYFKNQRGRHRTLGNGPEVWGMRTGSNGHLLIQDCDVVELAQIYGTPLYIVDKQRLIKNYLDFYNSFNSKYPHIEIGYSYKTNPLPNVIKILHEVGASAEVISPFELWLALSLDVPPQKIVYNGPGKTIQSLDVAIAHNIKLINIDGPGEIEIIDKLTRRYGKRQQVGVRVVASVGWAAQFGFELESGAAFRAFQQLSELPHVDPCGLHIHLGTGIRDISTYVRAIKEVLDFSTLLDTRLNIKIKYFDFGGGFGVSTVREYSRIDLKLMANDMPPRFGDASPPLSLNEMSDKIIALFKKYYPPQQKELPTLIFEPGRAITSTAQSLLMRVIAIKPKRKGRTILILDGGKNITMPTTWEYHEIFPASKMDALPTTVYSIYGPLCHPHDLLYRFKKLPEIKVGDILAIMDAGAYFIPNQMNFSFPRPSAIVVEDGHHQLIRDRETFEDMVKLDKIRS